MYELFNDHSRILVVVALVALGGYLFQSHSETAALQQQNVTLDHILCIGSTLRAKDDAALNRKLASAQKLLLANSTSNLSRKAHQIALNAYQIRAVQSDTLSRPLRTEACKA